MEYLIAEQTTVLEALRKLFPQSSRRTIQHWIKGNRFTIDHQRISRDTQQIEKGQTLRSIDIFRSKKAANIHILHEDRYFIVIDKPTGLLSVPLDNPTAKKHALGILRDYYQSQQIFPVHRIDREASGVMIFARGYEAQKKFDEMFEEHDLEREYFAILEGRLPEMKGRWESILKELPNFDVQVVSDQDGKIAITHYDVLRRSAKYTYVRLTLETGRKHQIRVHCKEAGCPILGDPRYGSNENPIHRLCLHARRLAFEHPFTKKKVSFIAPLPFAFKKLGATDQFFIGSNCS